MAARYAPYQIQMYNNNENSSITQKLVKNILKVFNKTEKKEKYKVLSIVADIISKKELRKSGFEFSNTMYNTAKRKRTENDIEERIVYLPESKKQKGNDIKELINEYLSKYSEITCKIHRNQPVMNLQESKLSIYKKKISENPEISLSTSKFYQLCPKNYKYCKKKTDMCEICVNGRKLEKRLGNNSKDIRIKYFKDHLDLNKDQKRCFRSKIDSLEKDECIVIMDFKENFKIGGGPVELSQSFYNKASISCLGFCIIYKQGEKIKRSYHDYISEVISHDSHFVKNCLKRLEHDNMGLFSKIHFWSDNAGHFRSQELRNYILLELPSKNYKTSQNFFVEYHGKSDIDGHFGLLQKVFNNYERLNDMKSVYDVLVCFWDYFLESEVNALFEIYEDPGRQELVQKLKIKDEKEYMSFFADSNNVYGKSVSTLEGSEYTSLGHKIICSREKRKTKYAPRVKQQSSWVVSSSQIRIMENRVAFKT